MDLIFTKFFTIRTMNKVHNKLNFYHFDLYLKATSSKTLLHYGLIVETSITVCSYVNVSDEFYVDFTNVENKMVSIIILLETKKQ